jgi:hypothetical protein
MEGLQDALDEAHYLCALKSNLLEPTLPFPGVSDDDIHHYLDDLREKHDSSVALENICRQPLGFYLVSAPSLLPLPFSCVWRIITNNCCHLRIVA